MEVLAGARHEREHRTLARFFAFLEALPFDAAIDFDVATEIYRTCRARGITPRSKIDCMIAAVAMRYGAPVLAHDGDFAQIARVMPLELDPATPR